MKGIALRVLIASVGISALMGIYALLAGDFGESEVRIILTTLCVSGSSILAMSCAAAWERGRLGPLPPVGVLASLVGFAVLIVVIWTEPEAEAVWKGAATLVILGSAAAHTCQISLARLAARFRWSLVLVYTSSFCLAAVLIAKIWAEDPSANVWRLIGILAIVLIAATVLVPVFQRMGRGVLVAAGEDEPAPASHCPRCGARIPPYEGESRCPDCRARFRVEFLERGIAGREAVEP